MSKWALTSSLATSRTLAVPRPRGGTSLAVVVASSNDPVSATSQILGSGLPQSVRSFIEQRLSLRSRTTADRSLAKRLSAGVKNAGVGSVGVAFYVHDGAVSMYGTVATDVVREDLIAVASAQPGVRRIVDHLRLTDA